MNIFSGHGADFLYDVTNFGIALIPFGFVAALIVASLFEEPLRVLAREREIGRASCRERVCLYV